MFVWQSNGEINVTAVSCLKRKLTCDLSHLSAKTLIIKTVPISSSCAIIGLPKQVFNNKITISVTDSMKTSDPEVLF